jgi:hypothetical protein
MQILNYPFLDMASTVESKGYLADEEVMARFMN